MSLEIDKTWISSSNIDNIAYTLGVISFLEYLSSEKVACRLCLCRKCRNLKDMGFLDVVTSHLLTYGIDMSYTTWAYHGDEVVEHPIAMAVNDNVAFNEGSMQDDHVPKSYHGPLQDKLPKNVDLRRQAGEPLYPSSRHLILDALVMLNDIKIEFSLSDAATEGVIRLLKELLLSGSALGPKFHELKCTLKEADLTYMNYDVCENNCMLFWKDDIDLPRCRKYNLSRYKFCVDSGKKVIGRKRKRGLFTRTQPRKVARKVMKYFPIIPRLKELYTITWIAESMTWHARAKSSNEFMRHPCDSKDWKNADLNWRTFARDDRSVRLALATNGFSPYGAFGAAYSCWPVILQPLNLLPSLAMKSEFSMLTVLIPDLTSPKTSNDVFIQPLIDNLNILRSGVEAFDADKNETFMLKAMLLWCIHDFPAYGVLSGKVTSGKVACPICSSQTQCLYLKFSKKCYFMCSRMWLPKDHSYRDETSRAKYDGKVEHRTPPLRLETAQVEVIVSTFLTEDGTSGGYSAGDSEEDQLDPNDTIGFKRRSIFFDLPFWSSHNIRHSLDIIHVEKNVTKNLLNTILKMKGIKDTLNAREDLKHLKINKKLWPKEGESNPPKASFVLSPNERDTFLSTLKRLRVLFGFSSNFANSVNLVTKSVSFKSHDYHMIMQHLLLMLLMHAYPIADKSLFKAIQRISIFFNVLCAKVVFKEHVVKAQLAVTEALCILETYFPPSFFVIMIHLMHHLADEVLEVGPTKFRAMWTYEREMKRYKKWAQNKRYIEGSIAEKYLLHEESLYVIEYTSISGQGTHKWSHDAFLDEDQDYSGHHVGKVNKVILGNIQYGQARNWIIKEQPWFDDLQTKYDAIGRYTSDHYKSYGGDDFIKWLQNEVAVINDSKMKSLIHGPHFEVDSYNKFHCNGYCFSTVTHDENKLVQNHSVSMKALDSCGVSTTYYGVIKGIFDLEYEHLTTVVFFCDWVNTKDRTTFKVDQLSLLPMLNLKKVMPSNHIDAEPFILTSEASQVFYCNESKFEVWSIILPSPRRLNKSIDSIEIDCAIYHSVLEENESLCALLDLME